MTVNTTTPADREGLAPRALFTPLCRPSVRFTLLCAGLNVRPLLTYVEVLRALADHADGARSIYTTPVMEGGTLTDLYLDVTGSTPQGFAAIYRAMREGLI